MCEALKAPWVALSIIMGLLFVLPSPDAGVVGREQQADCLWHSARNHGFYELQLVAISDTAGKMVAEPTRVRARDADAFRLAALWIDEKAVWQSFVASAGRDDCGPMPRGAEAYLELADALRERQAHAERQFRSPGGSVPVEERADPVMLAWQVH